jgi:hypothetical protein
MRHYYHYIFLAFLLTSALSADEREVRSTLGLVMTTQERIEVLHTRFIEDRRKRFIDLQDPYQAPPSAQIVEEQPDAWRSNLYPWHPRVQATVFWVGELPTQNNPTPNTASSWDPNWVSSYGGYDHPTRRKGYAPADFIPQQCPFYIALPYNDIGSGGYHKEDAKDVIPWFWRDYIGPSISVCHERWIAVHYNKRVCYAQWRDVGPFRTDDWNYVFRGKKPLPNRNAHAGIDLSPAVRDFLKLPGNMPVDWRFMESYEVPPGPWAPWVEANLPPRTKR